MTLLNIAIDMIPYNVVTLIVAFAMSWAIIKYQVRETRLDMEKLEKKVDSNKRESDDKNDNLLGKIHEISLTVREIHTILNNLNLKQK